MINVDGTIITENDWNKYVGEQLHNVFYKDLGEQLHNVFYKDLEKRKRYIESFLKWQKSLTPEVICLCGSTRFVDTFNEMRKKLTYEGKIILSIEIVTTQSAETDPQYCNPSLKEMLDELHLRKIDMADRVMILNVDGYIGESTRKEIEYAEKIGKPIEYLEN